MGNPRNLHNILAAQRKAEIIEENNKLIHEALEYRNRKNFRKHASTQTTDDHFDNYYDYDSIIYSNNGNRYDYRCNNDNGYDYGYNNGYNHRYNPSYNNSYYGNNPNYSNGWEYKSTDRSNDNFRDSGPTPLSCPDSVPIQCSNNNNQRASKQASKRVSFAIKRTSVSTVSTPPSVSTVSTPPRSSVSTPAVTGTVPTPPKPLLKVVSPQSPHKMLMRNISVSEDYTIDICTGELY